MPTQMPSVLSHEAASDTDRHPVVMARSASASSSAGFTTATVIAAGPDGFASIDSTVQVVPVGPNGSIGPLEQDAANRANPRTTTRIPKARLGFTRKPLRSGLFS